MGKPSLEEIKKEMLEKTKNWDFIKALPDKIDAFSKKLDGTIAGNILTICTYSALTINAKVDIIYTFETSDYILIRTMGLNTYRDISYIFREKDLFAAKVTANLPQILHQMEHPEDVNLGEMVADQHILTWQYGNSLPPKIGSFQLYIKPSHAIEHLNGSIILIDYTDFAKNDQLVIYYNRLRNDFYGEARIAGVFHATKQYDATNLTQLQEKLEKNLNNTLEKIATASHEI